jgi:leader peptidase (prepilin peptidase)/N-methyltransferase
VNVERTFPGIDTTSRVVTTGTLAVGIDAAMAWRFGWSAALPAYLYLGTISAVVTMTDLGARKIPEPVVLGSYPLAAALLAAASAPRGQWWALARGGIAMAMLGGFYLILGLAFARQVGIGDIELGGLLGLYLGWISWSALASGTLVAWLLPALAILARRAVSRGSRRGALAAGPFLAAGALVAALAIG